MKLPIILFLCLCGAVFGQSTSVLKNPNTNFLTGDLKLGAGRTLDFASGSLLMLSGGELQSSGATSKLKINTSGSSIVFSSVDAMLSVQAAGNHALVARTPNSTDGIAIVGWSSSGAAAVKAKQDTFFTSPTVTVWRDLSSGGSAQLTTSPGLMLAVNGGSAATESAAEVSNNGVITFKIQWDGYVTSRDKPVMRFLGRFASAPTGTYGVDFSAGDVYYNTSSSAVFLHDGLSWKAF